MDETLGAVRGHIRARGYRRVSHGLFLPLSADAAAEAEARRDLAAWLLVLPPKSVFTHVTAAGLAGWWVPPLPDWVPVFVALSSGLRGPRRGGLVVSRLVAEQEQWLAHGLPLAPPEEILVRCARDLGLLDLVPMIDSALRAGVPRTAIEAVCDTSRPGVRALRAGLDLADPRAESAWESRLRVFHACLNVPVVPQVNLYDGDLLLGRADLLVTGTNFVHEYDGAHHRDAAQQAADLRRDRRLAGSAYIRRGYTADDLLNHPGLVMAEIDRALGRRSRASRLARWHRLVQASMYASPARDRLRNRWVRLMGVNDWSQTA